MNYQENDSTQTTYKSLTWQHWMNKVNYDRGAIIIVYVLTISMAKTEYPSIRENIEKITLDGETFRNVDYGKKALIGIGNR